MYKLVAIDMDGTLLREDKSVSSRTKKAILNAREKGAHIVLASGRPVEGLKKYLNEFKMVTEEDYVLSYNGAVVKNIKTGVIITKNILKGKDLTYLYRVAKQLGVNIHAFSKLGCITPIMTKYSELEGTINGIPVLIKNYDEINQEEDIIKIMFVDEPEILEEAIKNLPEEVYEKYTVVRSAPYFLEFLNKKANKGEGVKALANHLDINQQEIICIGDAGNDVHMIEFAGLGVAMGNAFEEVKAIANYITHSNEDDGVAHVLEKFVI